MTNISSAQSEDNGAWKYFSTESLIIELKEQIKNKNQYYLPFLREKSMNAGIYLLPTGGIDRQQPHDTDEIYYVLAGKGKVKAGDKEWSIKKGDVIFVENKIEHRFFDIEDDIILYVVFSETDPSSNDIDGAVFTDENVTHGRDSKKNVWNQFLEVSTLRMGNYMLPKAIGGDKTRVHDVDEINLVVAGQGKFKIGNEIIDVAEGSIVYVKSGVGHNFLDIESDSLDVLILFVK